MNLAQDLRKERQVAKKIKNHNEHVEDESLCPQGLNLKRGKEVLLFHLKVNAFAN
jgi:hypothetical protein